MCMSVLIIAVGVWTVIQFKAAVMMTVTKQQNDNKRTKQMIFMCVYIYIYIYYKIILLILLHVSASLHHFQRVYVLCLLKL